MEKYSIIPLVKLLADARKRADVSQDELGRQLGLAQSYISAIESGKRDLRLSSFVELARAVGLEVMVIPASMVPTVRALTGACDAPARRSLYASDSDENEDDSNG